MTCPPSGNSDPQEISCDRYKFCCDVPDHISINKSISCDRYKFCCYDLRAFCHYNHGIFIMEYSSWNIHHGIFRARRERDHRAQVSLTLIRHLDCHVYTTRQSRTVGQGQGQQCNSSPRAVSGQRYPCPAIVVCDLG